MEYAMVTGRMDASKKSEGNAILKRMGMSASEAINLLYDRLISDQNAAFLNPERTAPSQTDWKAAFDFIDSISLPRASRFDDMTRSEIKEERLRSRGLL